MPFMAYMILRSPQAPLKHSCLRGCFFILKLRFYVHHGIEPAVRSILTTFQTMRLTLCFQQVSLLYAIIYAFHGIYDFTQSTGTIKTHGFQSFPCVFLKCNGSKNNYLSRRKKESTRVTCI